MGGITSDHRDRRFRVGVSLVSTTAVCAQVRISGLTGPFAGNSSTGRDPRYGAVREHQAIVVNTAYRGAFFSFNISGAGGGTFIVSVPAGGGSARNSSAMAYNANSTQLCAGVAPLLPINGCGPSSVICQTSTVCAVCAC